MSMNETDKKQSLKKELKRKIYIYFLWRQFKQNFCMSTMKLLKTLRFTLNLNKTVILYIIIKKNNKKKRII